MKKYSLKLITILFVNIFFTFPSLFAEDSIPEAIRQYNHMVNSAEISLIDGDYNLAAQQYKQAFDLEVYAFAVDKYNAAVCLVYLEKYSESFYLLKDILQKGYSIKNLKKEPVFDDFFQSNWGNRLIDFSENMVFTFNQDLRKTLDSLLYMDQLFRRNREFGNPYDFFEDTINRIDDSNRKMIESIIYEHGFPGEELIGLSDSSLTVQPYGMILLHLQQISTGRRRGEVENISPIVLAAYQSGRIPAHEASHLLEVAHKDFGSFSGSLFKIIYIPPGGNSMQISEDDIEKKEWGYYDLKDDETQIDKVRLDFGLESIDDFRKKLIFRLDNDTFNFKKIKRGTSIISTSNKEQYEYSNSNLILIR